MTTDSALPRSPLLLSRDQSLLLIIDAQVRLLDAIPLQQRLVWNLQRLVAGAEVLGVPCLATEQYPRVGPHHCRTRGSAGTDPGQIDLQCDRL